jgi:hypothetical protein
MASPQLSYVGSVDTSNASSGNVLFSLSFSSSIKALMFEYKYQTVGESVATLDNQINGFVYPDAVAPPQNDIAGLSSYVLPLPSPTGTTEYNVAVRVYHMTNVTSYTEWSNSLLVVRPPRQPVITTSLYDEGDYYVSPSRLWINLNASSVDVRQNSPVKYIASYFYVKENQSSTTWETTGLLDLDISNPQAPFLSFLMNGNVSLTRQTVYVAVNAVLPFTDINNNRFYSVSEISETETATPVEIVAPVISSLNYTELASGYQNIVVKWSPPTSSFIPNLRVASYLLNVKVYPKNTTPPSQWTLVNANIPPTVVNNLVSYDYVINTALYPQGYTFEFQVRAELVSGTDTPFSASQSVTQADINPPVQNDINYLVYTDTNRPQIMKVSWSTPVNSLNLTMAPSKYEIFLSVNNGAFAKVGESIFTYYDYNIPSEYWSTVITNLKFKVHADFTPSSGAFETADSNTKNLNTFTYATSPTQLFINWAVPDKQVAGGVDVSFTFTNVINPGLGNLQPGTKQYVCQIIDDVNNLDHVAATINVAYDGNRVEPYVEKMTFIPAPGHSAADYVVKVFLQTPDTNYLHGPRDGAARTSSSILVASVPVIYDVVVGGSLDPYDPSSRVSFKIASNVILAPVALMVYAAVQGRPEIPIPFNTSLVVPTYVLDNWIYTFDGVNALTIPVAFEGFVLTASNEAGIGFKIVEGV